MKALEEYQHIPHHFKKWKKVPWEICVNCGLVSFKNGFTQWAIDKGCNHRDYPSYDNQRTKHTKLFD